MSKYILQLLLLFYSCMASGQTNVLTYAGGIGKECFYDVMQLTDGTMLIVGYAEDLGWTGNSPKTILSYPSAILNSQGSNRFGFILHTSEDLSTLLHVVHFPQGAVEDVRFIKTNTQPYTPTGDLYISCNTSDTDNNNGGYILGKLNNNFVNGIPDALEWVRVVWAKSGPKDYHPWDVTSDGRVYYISGEAHGYDWSAMYCLNENGQRMVVPNWRTHWLTNGTEWKGTPASANPLGENGVSYSGIALKVWGRCELRSWNQTDFDAILPDGNGGTKKGKWPADFLFNSPCDPSNPTATGPGYNGYSHAAGSPVWGGSCISIDRRNNHVYLGMNFKSYYNPTPSPDFEPAVIAFDDAGQMIWWSRLYHEITPDGEIVGSLPDQYVDALAIDYANDKLLVGARCHGNNTENLWEGNTINANPGAFGFQNRFTGTNGDIHISWLGKLSLGDGTLTNSTYLAELAEGTGALGTPHADPNLDGWPDPNTGWPNVNTTRLAKNNIKVTSSGDAVVLALGRRTITTANAYQKMVKPYYGGLSAWNSFVRVYDKDFHAPKYTSLIVGVWDTLTQQGGGNTEMFGVYKTATGVVCVGYQMAEDSGMAAGNNIPVTNVPMWGSTTAQGQSAIVAYYRANNLFNENDHILTNSNTTQLAAHQTPLVIYPNPTSGEIFIRCDGWTQNLSPLVFTICDISGATVLSGAYNGSSIKTTLTDGIYLLRIQSGMHLHHEKFIIRK